jgi:hypothetical protein
LKLLYGGKAARVNIKPEFQELLVGVVGKAHATLAFGRDLDLQPNLAAVTHFL